MYRPDLAPEPPPLRVDLIVAATRTLFVRYGYRRTSVDDIAREAGVAKATLYLHFSGKEDMFRTMILRFRAEMNARCDAAEALDEPIETRVTELLYAHFGTALEWFGDAAHLSELKMFASEHPIGPTDDTVGAFRDRLHRTLTEAEQRGELAPTPRGASIADVATTLLFAAQGAKSAQKSGAAGMRLALGTIVALVVGGLRPG